MTLEPLNKKKQRLPEQLIEAWGHLSKPSIDEINQGLDKHDSLRAARPDIADKIFDTVGVSSDESEHKQLNAGRLFGDKEGVASSYMLYALVGLLSRSPLGSRGAKLRESIESLEIRGSALPELHGFAGLKHLRLASECESNQPKIFSFSKQIGVLKSLENLEIEVSGRPLYWEFDHLIAPSLKKIKALPRFNNLAKIHLVDGERYYLQIKAYTKKQLSPYSLWLVHGEDHAYRHARTIRIKDVARIEIDEPLRYTRLEGADHIQEWVAVNIPELGNHLNLGITSLSALEGLKRLEHLDLGSVAGINDLSQVPQFNESLRSLNLCNIPDINSLKGLSQCQELTSLSLSCCSRLSELSESSLPPGLNSLRIEYCPQVKSIKALSKMSQIRDVSISNCPRLKELPSAWPQLFTSLTVDNCPVERLGSLPSTFTGWNHALDLSSCSSIKTLEGIEQCQHIAVMYIHQSMVDISAAGVSHNGWIGIQYPTTKKLISLLSSLPKCKLYLESGKEGKTLISADDIIQLAQIQNLIWIDFSFVDIDIGALPALLAMSKLQKLLVSPSSPAYDLLGGGANNEEEMQLLRLRLLAI